MGDIRESLEQWELELLTPEARSSLERIDALIADDFMEIGSSGQTFGKDAVMKHLPLEKHKTFQASQVSSRMLSETVGLVTYLCLRIQGDTNLLTKRSSIWTKRGDVWQMAYHQATKYEA